MVKQVEYIKMDEKVIPREGTIIDNTTQIERRHGQNISAGAEKPLLKARPSWWNFFWYLVFGWLIIPLIMALWKRAGLLLYVYEDGVVLERGVISKHITQLLISDIRSVDIRQGMMQRVLGVGDILIGTAGFSGYEITALGLPKPRDIASLILSQRQRSQRTND